MTDNLNGEDADWWDARVAALECVLGKTDGTVRHALIPFQFGKDVGGAPDILYFRDHVPGVCVVTSDLIGCDAQITNELGNYELAICVKGDPEWGARVLCRLAYYTLREQVNPGDTMELGAIAPPGSNLTGLLFCAYADFEVKGRKSGVLLCIGITEDELAACLDGRRVEVEVALRAAGVFPFTEYPRRSVLEQNEDELDLTAFGVLQ
jgi:hypothetical protein